MSKQQFFSLAFPFEYDDSLSHAENRARFVRALTKAGRGEYRKRYPPNSPPLHAEDQDYIQDLDQATLTLCAAIYRTVNKRQNPYKLRRDFLNQLIHRLGPYAKGRHKSDLRSMAVAARILDSFLITIPYSEALLFLDGRQAWWGKCNNVFEACTILENGEKVYDGWYPSLLPTFPDPPLRLKKPRRSPF